MKAAWSLSSSTRTISKFILLWLSKHAPSKSSISARFSSWSFEVDVVVVAGNSPLLFKNFTVFWIAFWRCSFWIHLNASRFPLHPAHLYTGPNDILVQQQQYFSFLVSSAFYLPDILRQFCILTRVKNPCKGIEHSFWRTLNQTWRHFQDTPMLCALFRWKHLAHYHQKQSIKYK